VSEKSLIEERAEREDEKSSPIDPWSERGLSTNWARYLERGELRGRVRKKASTKKRGARNALYSLRRGSFKDLALDGLERRARRKGSRPPLIFKGKL